MTTQSSFSRVKKKQQPKALLWGCIFLSVFIFIFIYLWPAYQKIVTQKSDINQAETEIPNLLAQKEMVTQEQQKIEEQFYELAEPFELHFSKLLPESIDPTVYSKVFELYTLQQSIIENFPFEIEELSFSEAVPVQGKTYKSTNITMRFSANEKILRDFVMFLQTGSLSQAFHENAERGVIDTRAYKFIMKYGFPIAQIDSFDTTVKDELTGLLDVSMTFKVFSKE